MPHISNIVVARYQDDLNTATIALKPASVTDDGHEELCQDTYVWCNDCVQRGARFEDLARPCFEAA
jgi:hypothetical protein